jgi:hypothetical protein
MYLAVAFFDYEFWWEDTCICALFLHPFLLPFPSIVAILPFPSEVFFQTRFHRFQAQESWKTDIQILSLHSQFVKTLINKPICKVFVSEVVITSSWQSVSSSYND